MFSQTASSDILIELNQHCAGLSHILGALVGGTSWDIVYDWLMVAASIRKVEVDTKQHSLSFGWCAPSDEFDIAREKLLRQFVEDYSIFSFVWGALEAMLDIIKLPRHEDKSKRGKIRDACYFLNSKFTSKRLFSGLIEEVNLFRNAAQICLGSEAVSSRFSANTEFGDAGIGLYAVYELRNQFAHGSFTFPMPDEDNKPISLHEDMVKHATRVILIQLQMLLFSHFGQCDHPVIFSWHPGSTSEDIPFWIAIQTCHLKQGDTDFQLSIF